MTAAAFVLGGGINGLAVVRSLGRASVSTHLFVASTDDIACHSRYTTAHTWVGSEDPDRLVRQLKDTARILDQKPVLLYVSDENLEFVSSRRDELQEFCHLNLPSKIAIDTVIDKGKFGHFCLLHKLPAPRTWAPETQEQFEDCSERATYPVIVKPILAHHADTKNFNNDGVFAKMILVRNATDLAASYSRLTGQGANLLIQEYIEGADNEHYSYCSYRNADGEQLAGFGVRKIRLFPIHGGAGTFAEISDDTDLAIEAKNVIDKLQFKGVSSVCFKRDANTGKLMLHEVNGRFPMWHSASRLCGIDLPYLAYQDIAGSHAAKVVGHRGIGKWMALNPDISAFRSYRNVGELSALAWLRSLLSVRTCAEFALDDLRPFIYLLATLLQRVWRRAAKITFKRPLG